MTNGNNHFHGLQYLSIVFGVGLTLLSILTIVFAGAYWVGTLSHRLDSLEREFKDNKDQTKADISLLKRRIDNK